MEIILKEDVINLGYKGDIVKVKMVTDVTFFIPTKKLFWQLNQLKNVG